MRIRAMVRKELLDLARNRAALVPVVIMMLFSLAMPFFVLVILPAMTGRSIEADRNLTDISRVADPSGMLAPGSRVAMFLFQQFLILFLLTPITTLELLVAKVIGSLLPALAIAYGGLVLYFVGVWLFEPAGVLGALLSARTFTLVLLDAPAAALVSLQSAIVISSRVNDPRTAQQFGVLIIIPLAGLMVAEFSGSVWLSTAALALIGAGLVALWCLLSLCSVAIFDRETILTRWR